MKKIFIFLFFVISALPAFSEAIKLKNGLIVNGSIIGRTEYVLKVQTSYGQISLNQREVEKIMPDLHRVLLKGGGEYIGTVVDLDDFNLTLNTDNGLINVDVAQISSMEIYDYEEAAKQKKYVENKIEQETQAAQEEDKKKAAAATNMGASGLSFDDDLEKVFPSKPQETETVKYIYKTHEDTPEQKKIDAEEQTLLNALSEAEKEQQKKEEAISFDQNKKRKTSKNYFAFHTGIDRTSLKVNISELGGTEDLNMSGIGASFGLNYMRKVSDSFWFGGGLAFSMLNKNSTRYDYSEALPPVAGEQRDVQVSGNTYDFNALFNYYLNPKDPLRFYLTGGAGVYSISIDKSYADFKQNSSGDWVWFAPTKRNKRTVCFSSNIGLGLEWAIDDINIGLETRFRYAPLKNELENSSKISALITLKASWFF